MTTLRGRYLPDKSAYFGRVLLAISSVPVLSGDYRSKVRAEMAGQRGIKAGGADVTAPGGVLVALWLRVSGLRPMLAVRTGSRRLEDVCAIAHGAGAGGFRTGRL